MYYICNVVVQNMYNIRFVVLLITPSHWSICCVICIQTLSFCHISSRLSSLFSSKCLSLRSGLFWFSYENPVCISFQCMLSVMRYKFHNYIANLLLLRLVQRQDTHSLQENVIMWFKFLCNQYCSGNIFCSHKQCSFCVCEIQCSGFQLFVVTQLIKCFIPTRLVPLKWDGMTRVMIRLPHHSAMVQMIIIIVQLSLL